MNYVCPLGKSDQALVEFDTEERVCVKSDEQHKVGRYVHSKTKYNELRKFFREANWTLFLLNQFASLRFLMQSPAS